MDSEAEFSLETKADQPQTLPNRPIITLNAANTGSSSRGHRKISSFTNIGPASSSETRSPKLHLRTEERVTSAMSIRQNTHQLGVEDGADDSDASQNSSCRRNSSIVSELVKDYEKKRIEMVPHTAAKDSADDKTLLVRVNGVLYFVVDRAMFISTSSNTKSSRSGAQKRSSIAIIPSSHGEKLNSENTRGGSNFFLDESCCEINDQMLLKEIENNVSTLFDQNYVSILNKCRPNDVVRLIVQCNNNLIDKNEKNYLCVVSNGKNDKGTFLLGFTIYMRGDHPGENDLKLGIAIELRQVESLEIVGDGRLRLLTKYKHPSYFEISPIQNFWRLIQNLPRNLFGEVSHTKPVGTKSDSLSSICPNKFYQKLLTKDQRILFIWYKNEEILSMIPMDHIMDIDDEAKQRKCEIRGHLIDVMSQNDPETITMNEIRQYISSKINIDINPYRSFISNESISVYGQFQKASMILDYLYLGSQYNAADRDFLLSHNIQYILNVTKEIDNFFIGSFQYFNVGIYDVPESDLLPHFNDCIKFIETAKNAGYKCLVHCQMGISRSATVVIAYLMKMNTMTLEDAYDFVKSKRQVIHPNSGFYSQLNIFDGLLKNKLARETFIEKEQQK